MRMALVSSPAVLPRNRGARNFLNERPRWTIAGATGFLLWPQVG
jgi:hypothetical protein